MNDSKSTIGSDDLSPETIRDIYHGGIAETPDLEAKREAYEHLLACARAGVPSFLFGLPTAEQKNSDLVRFAEVEGLEVITISTPSLDPTELNFDRDLEDDGKPNG